MGAGKRVVMDGSVADDVRSSAPAMPVPRLRIAIISQYFHPEVLPINGLAEGLSERGHVVEVLTGLPNYPAGTFTAGYGLTGPWTERFRNITIKRVPLAPRGNRGTRIRIALNYISFALAGLLLAPWRMRGPIDVVFANLQSPLTSVLPGILLARARRRPFVIWIQDLWPDSLAVGDVRSRPIWRLMDALMRLVYRHSTLVFVQSRAFIGHAARYGFPAERVLYLPNWANEAFRLASAADAGVEDAELPKGFRVLFAGNIGHAQSPATIVEAAERLKGHPSIRIIVLGDGRAREWLEREIKQRQLHPTLSYLGHRPAERMPKYNAVSDALLVTLRKDHTMSLTVPSRLQSSLASGRPIVAALDGEARRIVVEAGAGLGVPAEDPEALAAAILSLSEMTETGRASMASAARRCYDVEFSRALLLDRVEAALSGLRGPGQDSDPSGSIGVRAARSQK